MFYYIFPWFSFNDAFSIYWVPTGSASHTLINNILPDHTFLHRNYPVIHQMQLFVVSADANLGIEELTWKQQEDISYIHVVQHV